MPWKKAEERVNSVKEKQKQFYGWKIVLAGAVVLGVSHGVVSNCFSLYIIPVSAALEINRDTFSVCSMIINGLYAGTSFLAGAIYRRLRLRNTIRVAAIALPISYFCYSLCKTPAALYAVSAAVGLSLSFISFVPFTTIIGNWFEEKRGTAMGLCFMGSGLGGMVMNSLTAVMLERYGWIKTYQATAVIMLITLLSMVFLVIRVTPKEMGLSPYGLKSGEQERVYGPGVKQAIRSGSFAALITVALAVGFDSSVISVLIAPHLIDLGYAPLFAAGVTSVYLGCLALAKILLGRVYDRVGAVRGTALSMLGFLGGYLGLYLSRAAWAVPLIMLTAMGTAASNVSYPVTTRYAFGTRSYTTLYGYMMGINFVMSSLGAVIANRIFTSTGSYNTVILICMGISLVGLASLRFIRPAKDEKNQGLDFPVYKQPNI